MYPLSHELAQDIVDRMMKDIPYNINIMNERGVIIGSGDRARIGSEHRGALQALATGRMVEVREDGLAEKKGTNEPIVIGQARIGVIGISGSPEEVRPFCSIVRTTVSLLIEQGMALQSMQNEANRKKAFLESLLLHPGLYSQKLRKEALAYRIDLLLPTALLHAKGLSPATLGPGMLLQHPFLPVEDDGVFFFMQDAAEARLLAEQLRRSHSGARFSLSRAEPSIAEAHRQAKGAMAVSLALKAPDPVVSYDEVEFLVQLAEADIPGTEQLAAKLEDKESADLLDTLRTYLHRDGSISAVSAELNIHRNTLQYRLKRIRDLTGKDPRHLFDLFELAHGLLALYR